MSEKVIPEETLDVQPAGTADNADNEAKEKTGDQFVLSEE